MSNTDPQAGPGAIRDSYSAPHLTMHGSLAASTEAFLIGPIIDSNHSQGMLIIGHTSF